MIFFFWFNKCKKEKKGRNNSWSPKISAAVVGLGIFGTLFFTNHLKLVNSIPVSEFFFQVFSFKCQRDKFTACFLFWKKRKKKKSKKNLTVLIFYYLMANNQMKCSIIYKKIAMRIVDDEQIMINGLALMMWIISFHFMKVGSLFRDMLMRWSRNKGWQSMISSFLVKWLI